MATSHDSWRYRATLSKPTWRSRIERVVSRGDSDQLSPWKIALLAFATAVLVVAAGFGLFTLGRYALAHYVGERAAEKYPVTRTWVGRRLSTPNGRDEITGLWTEEKIAGAFVKEAEEVYAAPPISQDYSVAAVDAKTGLRRHVEAHNALLKICRELPDLVQWKTACDAVRRQPISPEWQEHYKSNGDLQDQIFINRRNGVTALVDRHEVSRSVCGYHPYETFVSLVVPLSYHDENLTDDEINSFAPGAAPQLRYKVVRSDIPAGACRSISVGFFSEEPEVFAYGQPSANARQVIRHLQTAPAYVKAWDNKNPSFGGSETFGCVRLVDEFGSEEANCEAGDQKGYVRLERDKPWRLLDGGICAVSPSYCPAGQLTSGQLQMLAASARGAASPLAMQASNAGRWDSAYPYQLGVELVDRNGGLLPGIQIASRDYNVNPVGDRIDAVLAPGATILAVKGVAVYGMGDMLPLISAHMETVGNGYGVDAPIALVICPAGQDCSNGSGARTVYAGVFFDESYWRGRITNVQAFMAGVLRSFAGGADGHAFCAAQNAAIAAANCWRWLRQSFSSSYVANYQPFVNLEECAWRYRQWRVLALQMKSGAYQWGSVTGMLAPGGLAVGLRSTLSRRFTGSLLGKMAIEAADNAVYTVTTARKLDRTEDRRTALAENVALGAGGAVLFHGTKYLRAK